MSLKSILLVLLLLIALWLLFPLETAQSASHDAYTIQAHVHIISVDECWELIHRAPGICGPTPLASEAGYGVVIPPVI